MRTITAFTELDELACGNLPESLLKFVRDLFNRLYEEADGDEPFLQHHPICLFEDGDSLHTLLEDAPFGPEYVEQIKFPDGMSIYRIGILYDNDALTQIVIPAETLDKESKDWLAESEAYRGEEL